MSENIIKSTVNGTITGNLMETVLKGLSEYELAVKNGFIGTEEDWLASRSVQIKVTQNDKDYETGEGAYKIKFISGNKFGTTIEVETPDLIPLGTVIDQAYTGVTNLINPTIKGIQDGVKNLQDNKVDQTTTVNGYSLDENIVLNLSDIPVDDDTNAKTYVDDEVASSLASAKEYSDANLSKEMERITGLAPETLDSFEEIAKALNENASNDASLAETLNQAISLKADKTEVEEALNTKVDKKDGYSLISDTEISRLAKVDNYDDTSVVTRLSALEDIDLSDETITFTENSETSVIASEDTLSVLFGKIAKYMNDVNSEIETLKSTTIPLPLDDDGNVVVGDSGQVLKSNGDGTYSWVTTVLLGKFYLEDTDGIDHYFAYELGMTWEEFVNSSYNVGFTDSAGYERTLSIDDTGVSCSDGAYYNLDGSITDVITNGTIYLPYLLNIEQG